MREWKLCVLAGERGNGKCERGHKKREATCLPFSMRFETRLVHVYFDLPRFGFLHPRYAYLQDAVFVGGLNAVLLRSLGQGELTPELCSDPLDASIFNAVGRLFRLSFPAE